jgi:hypothetical protein
MTLFLLLACTKEVSPDVQREVESVRSAIQPSDARELKTNGPQQGIFSVSWEWRFVTSEPAARYRAQLIRALEPSFRCQEERRRVLCSRTLPGDKLLLDVRANPYRGDTLVKAHLNMSAD